MAYCRFSSSDWRSDVYVYADVHGGWTTHTAGRRCGDEVPRNTADPIDDFEEWYAQHEAQMRALEETTYTKIDSEYANKSYNDATIAECIERLEFLRAEGFHVPQYAIDRLREEDAENETD